ncbi:DNA-lyase 2 [Favolaschia claudopus]|uniref:DNA-(apurinic or apyrimidinic site) endonuclease n=1 Tax=Favolaschia claudopus TaxID=2862362 RepID=A0AAV9ZC70_9AGAR
MRILTWNINGIRTIPQYHPWNTMKTHDDILNLLKADIICFQEMKSSRANLPKAVGIPPSYHSFFSFPTKKSGYSGVAVYSKIDVAVPCKADEGLTGRLQPKPPLSSSERVSVPEAYPDEVLADDGANFDFASLDSEGRALVVDFGLFVLVNVYCPNDGTETEERLQYKMDFHWMLEARVKGLIEVEKRQVIVVGDLNACAAVIDHAEGDLMVTRGQAEGMQGEDGFWERDVRRWLRSWLVSDEPGSTGRLVDVVRRFWPERKGMYTCWNTKISARESNYGTRIDYILATPGLLPWIKAADIQPEIKGSDHCPVYIDLHDEIPHPTGEGTIKLRDVLGVSAGTEPPRIAAKFWDEYKQRLLDTFFGKKAEPDSKVSVLPSRTTPLPDTTPSTPSAAPESAAALPAASTSSSVPAFNPLGDDQRVSQSQPIPPSSSTSVSKRKREAQEPVASSSKKSKADKQKLKKAGQTSLASFFSKPKPHLDPSPYSSSQTKTSKSESKSEASPPPSSPSASLPLEGHSIDADYQFALSLSQSQKSSSPSPSRSSGESKKAWSSLLAPLEPPLCQVHGEPAKELTVNKPGPNKGKNFFICSRPVGPGYDRGKAERLREEVDPTWRCDFFKWSSEVRLEMARKRGG